MTPDLEQTRLRSAAVFGNAKVVQVALALQSISGGIATAQQISYMTKIGHGMVRDVLIRLSSAGVLRALPKTGGTRSPQYYEVADHDGWERLVDLASWALAADYSSAEELEQSSTRSEFGGA